MSEKSTKILRIILAIFIRIFSALLAISIILLDAFLIMGLVPCMFFAVIIFPLRKPIHNGINKLSSSIANQYKNLIESIAYDGEKKVLCVLSWIGILLLRAATILFLGYCMMIIVAFGIYSLFLRFLRQIVVDDTKGMYRETKNNFECIIAMISGGKDDGNGFIIGDERSMVRIIVGGIFKVPLRIGAIIVDGYSIMFLCACLIFTFWAHVLRKGICDAIKELGSRIGTHLKFITYVFLNEYPDFDIEGDYIEERHLKKDGTPDRRYRENK